MMLAAVLALALAAPPAAASADERRPERAEVERARGPAPRSPWQPSWQLARALAGRRATKPRRPAGAPIEIDFLRGPEASSVPSLPGSDPWRLAPEALGGCASAEVGPPLGIDRRLWRCVPRRTFGGWNVVVTYGSYGGCD